MAGMQRTFTGRFICSHLAYNVHSSLLPQVLLPPSSSVQYFILLQAEHSEWGSLNLQDIKSAKKLLFTSCWAMSRNNNVPIRGIMSSHQVLAAPLGFSCEAVDLLVSRYENEIGRALTQTQPPFSIAITDHSYGCLGPPDERWQRWLCCKGNYQVSST